MAELPTAWREELLARHARDHPEYSLILLLSYFPEALAKWLTELGMSRQAFFSEFRTVTSFRRGDKKKDHLSVPYFIDTQRLSLLVVDRPWTDKDTGQQRTHLAQIKHVELRDQRLLPDVVPDVSARAYEVYQMIAFDLREAEQRYKAALIAANTAVSNASRGILPVNATLKSRIKLGKQLLPARTILQLAARREAVVEVKSFRGTVLPGQGPESAADVLQVQLDEATSALTEDADIVLAELDASDRPAVSAVEGSHDSIAAEIVDMAGTAAILRPKNADDLQRVQAWSRVLVTRPPRERTGGPLLDAISRMADGRVVGSWEALTTLLTDPKMLPPVDDPGQEVQIDPELKLSPEQQEAVRRAVTARHAFFIQGPPGTGKTTVISEIVRQLVMRGERVLVAAQMHVAVDTLLARVTHDEHNRLIWPMRVSRKQELVDEELRGYWEGAVSERTAARIISRASAMNMDWPREIERLSHRSAVLERMRAAATIAALADNDLRQVHESGERESLEQAAAWGMHAIAEIDARMSALGETNESARETVRETQQWLTAAHASLASAAEERNRAQDSRREADSAVAEAERDVAKAQENLAVAAKRMRALAERLTAIRTEGASLRDRHEAAWRQDVIAFRDYLDEWDRWLSDAGDRPSAEMLAAQDRLANAEAVARNLHSEAERIAAVSCDRGIDVDRAGRKAHQAREAAVRAQADYDSQHAAADVVARALSALGMGPLAGARNKAAASSAEANATLGAYQASSQAAADAQAALEETSRQLDRAQSAVGAARLGFTRASERHADAAAVMAYRRNELADLRSRLTSSLDLPGAIAVIDQVSRLASPEVPELSSLAAGAGEVVARFSHEARTIAARIAQAESDGADCAAAQRRAAEVHSEATTEMSRCDAALSAARLRRQEAAETEAIFVKAEENARTRVVSLDEIVAEARTVERGATASLAPLTARRSALAISVDHAQKRLAVINTRMAELSAKAEATLEARDAAVSEALSACGGKLPADLDDDRDECQARIGRLEGLIDLQRRWQELIAEARMESPDMPKEFGRTLLDATNLVCSTAAGINGSPAGRNADFDTLVLDEASRVTDTEFLVPAVRARRWILVGDEMQLPPYVDQETEQHVYAMLALLDAERAGLSEKSLELALKSLADEHDRLLPRRRLRREPTADLAARMLADGTWSEHYREDLENRLSSLADDLALLTRDGKPSIEAARQSLVRALTLGLSLSRFEQCVGPRCPDSTRVQLTMQRRMIAPIAELVKDPVYGGRYETPPEYELRKEGIFPYTGRLYESPVTFYDTPRVKDGARSVGTGFANDFEANMVVTLLHWWDQMAGKQGLPQNPTYSVLSFYKAQAALIERRLSRRPLRNLQRKVIDSIDKIQGQESDLVVISFVRAHRHKGKPSQPRAGTVFWLQDIHRLNVAVTRAKMALALVGDRQTLEKLRGDEKAEKFYENLFRLLDEAGEGSGFPGAFEHILDAAP